MTKTGCGLGHVCPRFHWLQPNQRPQTERMGGWKCSLLCAQTGTGEHFQTNLQMFLYRLVALFQRMYF